MVVIRLYSECDSSAVIYVHIVRVMAIKDVCIITLIEVMAAPDVTCILTQYDIENARLGVAE